MEFIKNRISTNSTKTFKMMQITLEEDLNVPDSKPDIDKVIQTKGEVLIQEVESLIDKIRIQGELIFRILYATPQEGLGSFTYHFRFEEIVYMDGILPMDIIKVGSELDDLNVTMINSRKLEIRSLIGLKIKVIDTDLIEGIVDVEQDDSIQFYHKPCQITGMVADKKDMVRLKEEVSLPASKPNISELLWESVSIRNVEPKLLDGAISIRGELLLFTLYKGEEEHIPYQNIEWEIPFETQLECKESKEEMIGNIKIGVGSCQVELKPDTDGEERELSLDCSLDLDIKIYQEEEVNFLRDIYSPIKELELEKNMFDYESLLVKNSAKKKIVDRVRLKEHQGTILQICHVEGEAKIDEAECIEDGIQVEGVIMVNIVYVSSDDRYPISCLSTMLPFSQVVEARGVSPDNFYDVDANIEQISAIMIDSSEIEIKASLNLDVIAFSKKQGVTIVDVIEKPFNEEAFGEVPGIVGYIVQQGDNLWKIAKRFYTTVDDIKEMNNLEEENISTGDKLIIIKSVREPLEA